MKAFVVLSLVLLSSILSFSQVPERISYQSILTDSNGSPIKNEEVAIKLSIYEGPGTTKMVYSEEHNAATNAYGMVSLFIGGGTNSSSSFSSIQWGVADHYLGVEINRGEGYASLGSLQFLTVPYAMVSKKAIDMKFSDLKDYPGTPVKDNILKFNGSKWIFTPEKILKLNDLEDFPKGVPSNGHILKYDGTKWIFVTEENIAGWYKSTTGIYNNNRIGLGTTNPSSRLHINSNSSGSYPHLMLTETEADYARITFNNTIASTKYWTIASYTDKDNDANSLMNFWYYKGTSGRNHMTINGNGFIGVGTTNPTSELHIKQQNSDYRKTGLRLERLSGASFWNISMGNSGELLLFNYGEEPRGSINNSTGAYTAVSDIKLKENIRAMENSLAKIMSLKPSVYNFKGQESSRTQYGFIAQEVEQVFPEMVYDMEDGTKSLAYDEFSVLAIKAIQEQQKIIEELQKKITEIEKKINK